MKILFRPTQSEQSRKLLTITQNIYSATGQTKGRWEEVDGMEAKTVFKKWNKEITGR